MKQLALLLPSALVQHDKNTPAVPAHEAVALAFWELEMHVISCKFCRKEAKQAASGVMHATRFPDGSARYERKDYQPRWCPEYVRLSRDIYFLIGVEKSA